MLQAVAGVHKAWNLRLLGHGPLEHPKTACTAMLCGLNAVQCAALCSPSPCFAGYTSYLVFAIACLPFCCRAATAVGVNPAQCLPLCVDFGTNNKALLEDPAYKGLRRRRCGRSEFDGFMSEVMGALAAWQPHVMVQFEVSLCMVRLWKAVAVIRSRRPRSRMA